MSTKGNKRFVFTTKKVEEIQQMMDDGFIPRNEEMPYYDKKIGLRREKVPFGFTKMEEEEYIKCKLDVKYFANNFCSVKKEDGKYGLIRLRDYQYDILDMFQNPKNKFNILLASRQIGKCVSPLTKVKIRHQNTTQLIPLYHLHHILNPQNTLFDKIKYQIYKLIDKLS